MHGVAVTRVMIPQEDINFRHCDGGGEWYSLFVDELLDTSMKKFMAQLRPGQIATALFQALPDVLFWIKDADGRFVSVNKAFCHDVSVLNAEEMMGLKDVDIFPAELAEVFQRGDEEVLASRVPMWNKSELVSNRSGHVEWRLTSKIPLQSTKGEWIGTAGISRKMGRVGEVRRVGQHHKMAMIVDALYEHLEESISVSELATAASVSVSTLERLFKEHMNTTPRRFIIQVKMSTACDRLMNTDMKINEISTSLGFHEHANFTRAFTKTMGISPRSYREFYKMG